VDALAAALDALRLAKQPVGEAMYALYVAHSDSLHATLRRLTPRCDADDLLQDVFLIALRQPETVLGARSPRAWLHGVALKVARAHRRRELVRRVLSLQLAAEVASDEDVHRRAEWRDRAQLARAALEKLSPKKREVFVLFELQGLEGEEIAGAIGCPLKTVWSRLAHARIEFLAAAERLERGGRR
jgi:RNA polymerase sigma-70 factor, ECF subfamily